MRIGPEYGSRLFEVAAYRLSPSDWWQEQEDAAHELHFDWKEAGVRVPGLMERARDIIHGEIAPFAYNEIVGSIRILWDGPAPVLNGFYSKVEGNRFPRKWNRRRPYRWAGKLFELGFEDGDSNALISSQVKERLVDAMAPDRPFCGSWLDLEPFDTISPALDWRLLIGLDD